jgi:autotransporter-associated beta strand protein
MLLTSTILCLHAREGAAQAIDVASESALRDAILISTVGSRIVFQADIELTADLPVIQQSLTIDGNGHILSGNDIFRGFFVLTGTVTIRSLTIAHAAALGGRGGDAAQGGSSSGGGGAGLGGGLFVASNARVTIRDVQFVACRAAGGDAGMLISGLVGAGAGGGMGGVGGTFGGGGGGLGIAADGGTNGSGAHPNGLAGIAIGAAPGGAGSAGTSGGANGGGGGSGGSTGGGGGIGGQAGSNAAPGAGGFGGGGGATGAPGSGGAGGFGGGGGGVRGIDAAGGNGGFGGGGGGQIGTGTAGLGGFGAGTGARSSGGGGAGMGGAIFVMDGGSLTIAGTLAINGGTVAGGLVPSGGGQQGSAFGSGIFLQGDGILNLAPDAMQVESIADGIVDMTGLGGAGANAGEWRLLKSGAGALELSGANSFTNGVTVLGGVLRVASSPSLGYGPLTLSGGILQSSNGIDFTREIALGGDGGGIDVSPIDWTVSGSIAGAGSLTVTGGRTLTLAGANFYGGGTIVHDGTIVAIQSDGNLGAPTAPLTLDGGLLVTRASLGSTRPVTIGPLGGTIATGIFNPTFAGNIDGPGPLSKIGAGLLMLSGNNVRTGALVIAEGQIRVGQAASLSPLALVSIDPGAVLDINSLRPTIGSLSGLGSVVLGTGALTVGADGTTRMFAGEISGIGSLIKIGAGTLRLIGGSTYSGGTALNGGQIELDGDAGLGDVAGALSLGGGTLKAIASWTSVRPIIVTANGGTIDADQFAVRLSGPVTGPGTLRTVSNGPGTWTLANTGNSYTGGTTVDAGTLRLGASHVIPDVGTFTVSAGATFDLGGLSETVGPLAGHGTILVSNALRTNATGSSTFAGTLTGGSNIFKSGTGTLTLSGVSALSGSTNLESGGLTVTGTLASSPFIVTGGTLAGGGTIGPLTMTGGTLAPGGPARLTITGDATLGSGSTFAVVVNGTLPGSGHDQLVVDGRVTLAGTLQVSLTLPAAPDLPLVILDNDGTDPISGTFAALPEGATLTIGTSRFRISYIGGSGNDVVLSPAPPEALTYYLAEGATGAFFDLDLLIANPQDTPVPITIDFLTQDGVTVTQNRTLPATSRTTIRVDDIPGLESTALSTLVTSTTGAPIVVERTMRWDASGYGAHTEKATDGAAPTWYFAEGSQGFFFTYFLLVNPQSTPNTATVTYVREGEAALVRQYALPARARVTIDAGADPELVNRSFGARIDFAQPAVAERSMYFGRDPLFTGGDESAGATALATDWFLAEGATGSYFTTFVLLANLSDADTTATVTYFPAGGTPIVKQHAIPAQRRLTLNIAAEDPALASAAVATRVESATPIVVERAQYWPNPDWIESHNSGGMTETGTRWGLAEGRVGGPTHYQTYILLANTGTQAADVVLTFLRTDGTTLAKTVTVPPASRLNVAVTGPGSDVPQLADEDFGTLIVATHPIVVERSMYSDANGVTWAAGTNATATRLPE